MKKKKKLNITSYTNLFIDVLKYIVLEFCEKNKLE